MCSNLFGHSNKGPTGLLFLKAGSHYVANLLSTCNSQLHFYREIENFLSLHCYSPMQFCSNLSEPGFRYCNYPAGNLSVFRIIESCQTCFFQDARLRSEPEDHVEGRVEAPLLRQVVVLSKTFGRRVPAHPQTRDLKP